MAWQQSQNRIYYSLLYRVGSEGPYQNKSMAIIFTLVVLGSSCFFVNAYLFYQQPYKCKSSNCDQFVCSFPVEQRSKYRTAPTIVTLGNYNGDNHCQTLKNVTVMEQAMLLGASLGLLIGILFADFLGRRLVIIYSITLTILGLLMVVGIQDIKFKCLGLLIWGAGSEIYFSVLYYYISEIVAEKNRSKSFVILNIGFATGTVANTILFLLVRNWTYVIIFYYVLFHVIALIVFTYYVQSPPIQIISRSGSAEEVFAAFQRIASRNGVDDHGITLEEIQKIYTKYHQNQQAKQHSKYFSLLDVLRYDSLRMNFIKLSIICFCLMFLLYAPALLLHKLFQDIFLNGFINGISQFTALPLLAFVNATLSRRKGLTAMFLATTLFTLLQFFLNPTDCLNCKSPFQSILALIFFFAARFSINLASNFFANTLNETFPAQIKGVCIYAVFGVGRLSTLAIPYMPQLKKATHLSYNLWFGIVGLLGVMVAITIKQTIGVPPPQMIEQLRFQVLEEDK